uniref:THD domain-containing protein n=1 Tax=Monopterus albus TaxID=43700 RepID=A0A3Q3Q5G5_MONAL
MEAQPRSSHKYLVLQVWCGLLTVAMVVMAALLVSIRPNENLHSPSASLDSTQAFGSSWQKSLGCHSCSLVLRNNSIHCTQDSLYFFYAQVTFTKQKTNNTNKYVILKRNATFGKQTKKLIEGTFQNTTVSSVWVAKIVRLQNGDSVSLEINSDYRKDSTFWGAYQLR